MLWPFFDRIRQLPATPFISTTALAVLLASVLCMYVRMKQHGRLSALSLIGLFVELIIHPCRPGQKRSLTSHSLSEAGWRAGIHFSVAQGDHREETHQGEVPSGGCSPWRVDAGAAVDVRHPKRLAGWQVVQEFALTPTAGTGINVGHDHISHDQLALLITLHLGPFAFPSA